MSGAQRAGGVRHLLVSEFGSETVLSTQFHQKYYYFFGIIFSLLFYLAFFKLIVINSKKDFFIYALAILSPPVMLAIERGNTDLFIFFLCFIYISLLQKNNIISNIFSYILIFFSSLLKFYK